MENKSVPEILLSDSEYDVVERLSTWEFISPSDDEDDVDFAFPSSSSEEENDTVDVDDDGGDVLGPKEEGFGPYINGSPSSDISMNSMNYLLALGVDQAGDDVTGPHSSFGADPGSGSYTIGSLNYFLALEEHDYEDDECDDNENEDDDDDDDEYYDGYDLDDELVPRSVRGKFGRERIKKLGKRGGYPRMNKSKKLPYYYNRPGCVYGKHGLGVQHSYI